MSKNAYEIRKESHALKGIFRTTIDIPVELNEKLVQVAKASDRSRNAQLMFILKDWFAWRETQTREAKAA